MGVSRLLSAGVWHLSEVIWCISNLYVVKPARHLAKLSEIGDSGTLVQHIWDTFVPGMSVYRMHTLHSLSNQSIFLSSQFSLCRCLDNDCTVWMAVSPLNQSYVKEMTLQFQNTFKLSSAPRRKSPWRLYALVATSEMSQHVLNYQ